MKTFTYDFEGRFISTDKIKKNKQLNVSKAGFEISQ